MNENLECKFDNDRRLITHYMSFFLFTVDYAFKDTKMSLFTYKKQTQLLSDGPGVFTIAVRLLYSEHFSAYIMFKLMKLA